MIEGKCILEAGSWLCEDGVGSRESWVHQANG